MDFKKWLETQVIESNEKDGQPSIRLKEVIDEGTDPDTIRLRLKGNTAPLNHRNLGKRLGLTTSISLNNITCVDQHSIRTTRQRFTSCCTSTSTTCGKSTGSTINTS